MIKSLGLPSKRIGEATIRKVINKLIAEAPVHGHHPEESYEEGTIENLMLDKETTHGGWPEGPSRSFTSNKKVNAQIADWLKDMKMVKKVKWLLRLFTEHPRSVGETYCEHFAAASKELVHVLA